MFDEGDLVFSYPRKQAIEDGILVDLTDFAKNHGFKIPVAMNIETFQECFVTEDEMDSVALSGFFVELFLHIKLGKYKDERRDLVEIFFLGNSKHVQTIWAHVGPGDDAEPVLTACYPRDL